MKAFSSALSQSSGQILIEVIIASLVTIMVSLAITQLVSQSLKGADVAMSQTGATFLAGEVADAVRAIAQEDWHNLSNLATSSANRYHPVITGGKWVASTTIESVPLNNLTYTRSFYLTDVRRSTSTSDIVLSGGYYDPSTLKVNIVVNWNDSFGSAQVFTQAEYVSRFLNQTFAQTDWSGGSVGETVTTVPTNTFATSTNADVTSTAGSASLLAQ